MSQMHYTRKQVMDLQPEISDMVRVVIRDGLNKDSNIMGNEKKYKLVTDKETGEYVDFEFIFKKNALDELMGGNAALPGVRDMEAYRKRPFATATTFIQNRPYAITFQQEDFDRDIEETMQMSIIDEIGKDFLSRIISGMASGWYHHGLRDRIALWNSEGNFEAIKDQFDNMIEATWNDAGYSIDVLVPDHDNPEERIVIKRDVSFDGLSKYADNNKNADICQRYIDLGVVSLLVLGYVEKDFSWTLN